MVPVFIDLKGIKVYTFGIFLVLAFFWGAFLLWKNFRLTAYKEEDIFDGLFISLVGGLVGARAVYVILDFSEFKFNFLKYILVNGYPGLSLMGGLLSASIVLAIFMYRRKFKFTEYIDYFVTPLFVALGFGKLGSFFSGTEVGTVTKLPVALHYAGYAGARHLTALYEAILFFVGAYIAQRILYAIRREKYRKGFSWYFFWLYFSTVYFLFDKFKDRHIYFVGQSFNLALSLLVLPVSAVYLLYQLRAGFSKQLMVVKNSATRYGKKTFGSIRHKSAKKIGETPPGAPESGV